MIRKSNPQETANHDTSARHDASLIVPMITPLNEDGGLDTAALPGLIEHLVAGGADALFVLGTTGEGPSLSAALRRELVGSVATLLPDGFPFYVCISDPCIEDALAMSELAAEAGAVAVAATAPFYFPLSDEELASYFETLAARSALPVMIYNFPRMTGTAVSADVVARLADVPGLIGVKDSSGDADELSRLLSRVSGRPGFSVLVGNETLLPTAIRAGATGGVCGTANVVPGLFRGLLDAITDQDAVLEAQLLHDISIAHRLFNVGSQWGRHVVNLKFAMSQMGLCQPHVASPLHAPSADQQSALAQIVKQLNNPPALHGTLASGQPATPASNHSSTFTSL